MEYFVPVLVLCAVVFAIGMMALHTIRSNLDFRSGESICLSLAVMYYFFGRPILWEMFRDQGAPRQAFDGTTGILPCLLLGVIAVFIQLSKRKRGQQIRDFEANRLLKNIQSGSNTKFFVYLRSFRITNSLPVSSSNNDIQVKDGKAFADLDSIDFEGALVTALEPIAPFTALGRTGEAFGAGRIETDDANWQSMITPLIAKSAMVFLIPSLQSGTVWEIEHLIANRFLSKTVFVLPPGYLRRDWESICDRLAKPDFGLKLHRSQSVLSAGWARLLDSRNVTGCFFMLNNEGNEAASSEFDIDASSQAILDAVLKLWTTATTTISDFVDPQSIAVSEPKTEQVTSRIKDEHGIKRSFEIVTCPNCQTRVIPCATGECPSCRKALEHK
jgi:hypothetical protein